MELNRPIQNVCENESGSESENGSGSGSGSGCESGCGSESIKRQCIICLCGEKDCLHDTYTSIKENILHFSEFNDSDKNSNILIKQCNCKYDCHLSCFLKTARKRNTHYRLPTQKLIYLDNLIQYNKHPCMYIENLKWKCLFCPQPIFIQIDNNTIIENNENNTGDEHGNNDNDDDNNDGIDMSITLDSMGDTPEEDNTFVNHYGFEYVLPGLYRLTEIIHGLLYLYYFSKYYLFVFYFIGDLYFGLFTIILFDNMYNMGVNTEANLVVNTEYNTLYNGYILSQIEDICVINDTLSVSLSVS